MAVFAATAGPDCPGRDLFAYLGIAGLVYSIWYILGKLENPFVCKV